MSGGFDPSLSKFRFQEGLICGVTRKKNAQLYKIFCHVKMDKGVVNIFKDF